MNVGVLQTAHSIFRPWRAATRSDSLFTTINYVLSRFAKPYLQLLRHTSSVLLQQPPRVSSQADLEFAAQTQVLLVELFYDLTCQDLPPDFEDNHQEFFGPQGIFLQFLDWNPPQLSGEVQV